MAYNALNAAKDLFSGQAQFASKEDQDKRIAVCNLCPEQQKTMRVCKACGCFIPTKVKFQLASCPKSKW